MFTRDEIDTIDELVIHYDKMVDRLKEAEHWKDIRDTLKSVSFKMTQARPLDRIANSLERLDKYGISIFDKGE